MDYSSVDTSALHNELISVGVEDIEVEDSESNRTDGGDMED